MPGDRSSSRSSSTTTCSTRALLSSSTCTIFHSLRFFFVLSIIVGSYAVEAQGDSCAPPRAARKDPQPDSAAERHFGFGVLRGQCGSEGGCASGQASQCEHFAAEVTSYATTGADGLPILRVVPAVEYEGLTVLQTLWVAGENNSSQPAALPCTPSSRWQAGVSGYLHCRALARRLDWMGSSGHGATAFPSWSPPTQEGQGQGQARSGSPSSCSVAQATQGTSDGACQGGRGASKFQHRAYGRTEIADQSFDGFGEVRCSAGGSEETGSASTKIAFRSGRPHAAQAGQTADGRSAQHRTVGPAAGRLRRCLGGLRDAVVRHLRAAAPGTGDSLDEDEHVTGKLGQASVGGHRTAQEPSKRCCHPRRCSDESAGRLGDRRHHSGGGIRKGGCPLSARSCQAPAVTRGACHSQGSGPARDRARAQLQKKTGNRGYGGNGGFITGASAGCCHCHTGTSGSAPGMGAAACGRTSRYSGCIVSAVAATLQGHAAFSEGPQFRLDVTCGPPRPLSCWLRPACQYGNFVPPFTAELLAYSLQRELDMSRFSFPFLRWQDPRIEDFPIPEADGGIAELHGPWRLPLACERTDLMGSLWGVQEAHHVRLQASHSKAPPACLPASQVPTESMAVQPSAQPTPLEHHHWSSTSSADSSGAWAHGQDSLVEPGVGIIPSLDPTPKAASVPPTLKCPRRTSHQLPKAPACHRVPGMPSVLPGRDDTGRTAPVVRLRPGFSSDLADLVAEDVQILRHACFDPVRGERHRRRMQDWTVWVCLTDCVGASPHIPLVAGRTMQFEVEGVPTPQTIVVNGRNARTHRPFVLDMRYWGVPLTVLEPLHGSTIVEALVPFYHDNWPHHLRQHLIGGAFLVSANGRLVDLHSALPADVDVVTICPATAGADAVSVASFQAAHPVAERPPVPPLPQQRWQRRNRQLPAGEEHDALSGSGVSLITFPARAQSQYTIRSCTCGFCTPPHILLLMS